MSSLASIPQVPSIDSQLALQSFAQALDALTRDRARGDPVARAARVIESVRALPAELAPAALSTVRRLATDAFLRLCHDASWHCGELELRCDAGRCVSAGALADLLSRNLQVCLTATSSTDGPPLDSRIVRAIAYIRANCTRPSLVVEDVARHVGLSRWHLTRLFVRALGASYRDVLRSARMDEAERLLLDDALSVKEVAVRLGYPHATELDRVFKQHAGMTPTAWRRGCQSGVRPRSDPGPTGRGQIRRPDSSASGAWGDVKHPQRGRSG